MTKIYNVSGSKPTRKALRRNATQPEILLWAKIRNNQLLNCKFRRQYSIGIFVLDFYCPQQKLAIEIDGDSHFNTRAIERDIVRQNTLNHWGLDLYG